MASYITHINMYIDIVIKLSHMQALFGLSHNGFTRHHFIIFLFWNEKSAQIRVVNHHATVDISDHVVIIKQYGHAGPVAAIFLWARWCCIRFKGAFKNHITIFSKIAKSKKQ